jgi:predicted hydrocarbon binding protein
MSRRTFAAILRQLRTVLGRGVGAVCYSVGFDAGRRIVPMVRDVAEARGPEEVVEAMGAIDGRAGWFLLVRFDLEPTGDAVIVVRKSVEAQTVRGESDRAVCEFLRGYFGGFVSALVDRSDLESTEERCEGTGDDECRFRIAPRKG